MRAKICTLHTSLHNILILFLAVPDGDTHKEMGKRLTIGPSQNTMLYENVAPRLPAYQYHRE